MRNICTTILSANDDVTRTGAGINTNQIVSASFQPVFGDTAAAGTVKIQASNDFAPNPNLPGTFVPTNWSDVTGASSTIVAGVGPMISIANMNFQWVRAVFTQSAPGGTTVAVQMNALSI